MKAILYGAATVAALLSGGAALAGQRTATIEVTGLYCSSCPYIAAQAIMSVPSANIVDGFYDPQAQMAHFVVEYDDTLATLQQLVGATSEYGYPAKLIEQPADGNS